jgi:dienelactone hydrolase
MNTILISDVFGITPALLKLRDKLGATIIVDPYQGKSMDFKNETDAYAYFITEVGLEHYVSNVSNVLEALDGETILIGFSVGASAIWQLSQNNKNSHIKQAFCFYGSQIRNFKKIEPCFQVNLIFPKNELHFDVVELIEKLKNKFNVRITKVDYLHGFMNYYSSNFNEIAYQEHVDLLLDVVK